MHAIKFQRIITSQKEQEMLEIKRGVIFTKYPIKCYCALTLFIELSLRGVYITRARALQEKSACVIKPVFNNKVEWDMHTLAG